MEDGTVSGLVESIQKMFADAIAKGEAVMADENATREEVLDAAADLMFAVHALDMKAADKTDLEMALELAEMIDLSKYVEAGQAEYLAAKDAAEAVMADGDAMQAGDRRGMEQPCRDDERAPAESRQIRAGGSDQPDGRAGSERLYRGERKRVPRGVSQRQMQSLPMRR